MADRPLGARQHVRTAGAEEASAPGSRVSWRSRAPASASAPAAPRLQTRCMRRADRCRRRRVLLSMRSGSGSWCPTWSRQAGSSDVRAFSDVVACGAIRRPRRDRDVVGCAFELGECRVDRAAGAHVSRGLEATAPDAQRRTERLRRRSHDRECRRPPTRAKPGARRNQGAPTRPIRRSLPMQTQTSHAGRPFPPARVRSGSQVMLPVEMHAPGCRRKGEVGRRSCWASALR
jgi:hypothetical protein